jgi:hypothetical protein
MIPQMTTNDRRMTAIVAVKESKESKDDKMTMSVVTNEHKDDRRRGY